MWPAAAFSSTGETEEHSGRRFCRHCGSRMYSLDENEAEIKLGTLADAPTGLTPSYELWVKRREDWLVPVEGAEQYDEDRPR
jgi:hypothetical protein